MLNSCYITFPNLVIKGYAFSAAGNGNIRFVGTGTRIADIYFKTADIVYPFIVFPYIA